MADLAFWAALGCAAWTFFPEMLAEPWSVATLMVVGGIGAGAVGSAHEGATLALLFAVSETISHRTHHRTEASFQSLLDLVPGPWPSSEGTTRFVSIRRNSSAGTGWSSGPATGIFRPRSRTSSTARRRSSFEYFVGWP
ncbi:MAG: hypothetical protein LC792_05920 [Actinobacteria bacterium]|nr:hypothetical protein [Actinomycetota bacterium]